MLKLLNGTGNLLTIITGKRLLHAPCSVLLVEASLVQVENGVFSTLCPRDPRRFTVVFSSSRDSGFQNSLCGYFFNRRVYIGVGKRGAY